MDRAPSPSPRRRRLAAALLAALYLPPLAAHDLWLEPAPFRPAAGEMVRVTLRLGDPFSGESWPRIAPHIQRFTVRHGDRERPVSGSMGDDPAGYFKAADDGAYTLLYWSRPEFTAIGAEEFEAFLKARGLERIIGLRQALGETGRDAGEYDTRCAKALVVTREADGNAAAAAHSECDLDLTMGPTTPPGGETPFRLHFEGKPLAGALVTGIRKGAPEETLSARTDRSGEARFPSIGNGMWLFSAVHMVREEHDRAQWHGYWATLNVERQETE
ncbi:DUF4198 domain-containing protein [Endothiovibrio diazotrophicus]